MFRVMIALTAGDEALRRQRRLEKLYIFGMFSDRGRGMLEPYRLPHECESEEIAGLLARLTPRQRRVLRAYVWQVELGEKSLTAWLAEPACPVARSTWYKLRDRAAFQDALDAYRRAGLAWAMNQEKRSVEAAQRKLRLASSGAAERLTEQAQADIGGFFRVVERWTEEPMASQEIIREEEREVTDVHGKSRLVRFYLVRQAVLDLERLADPQYARLVKKFSDSPTRGVAIEVYDAQAAVVKVLESQGMLRPTAANLNVDLGSLSDEQLERVAAGEDVMKVLASGGMVR